MKYNNFKSELFEFSFLSGVQLSGVFFEETKYLWSKPLCVWNDLKFIYD